jgi:hypothetical protein
MADRLKIVPLRSQGIAGLALTSAAFRANWFGNG